MSDFDGLAPIFQRQLQALIMASHGRVRLVSGYRSSERQKDAFQEAEKRYPGNADAWFADPQHSNHVKGAAADLGGDLTIAHQLAPQFGLAFPMSWEEQHVEMASTRHHANPLAYTRPPPGAQNPVHADLSTSLPHTLAALSEALLPTSTNGLGTAGIPYGTGQRMLDAVEGPPPAAEGTAAQGTTLDTSGKTTVSAGGANIPTGKGNIAPTALYGALTAAGLDPVAAAAFVSIAGRESGYNTNAFNGNAGTGDKSYGLFQINLLNGGWTSFLQAHGIADPAHDLLTLEGSVRAAAAIYGSSGLHPWGGYKGMPWSYSTNLQAGADASGGAVTVQDLQNLGGG